MIGKVNSVIISLAFIILSCVHMACWYFYDVLNFDGIWVILFTNASSIISYTCYLNSGFNKIIAFILALVTSVICFYIYTYTYYLKVNFDEYLVRSSGVITGLFILMQIIIGLIFAIIYFVVWWKQRK
jgi:hypothetical protein